MPTRLTHSLLAAPLIRYDTVCVTVESQFAMSGYRGVLALQAGRILSSGEECSCSGEVNSVHSLLTTPHNNNNNKRLTEVSLDTETGYWNELFFSVHSSCAYRRLEEPQGLEFSFERNDVQSLFVEYEGIRIWEKRGLLWIEREEGLTVS